MYFHCFSVEWQERAADRACGVCARVAGKVYTIVFDFAQRKVILLPMSGLESIRCAGAWSAEEVSRHLESSVIPLRLGAMAPSGYPLVFSLWYFWDGRSLWCASQRRARVVQHCLKYARCGFEVAGDQPPYCGVRGAADVTVVPEEGERILRHLIARYLQSEESALARWLLERVETEVALRITPVRIYSWNYEARMKDVTASPTD